MAVTPSRLKEAERTLQARGIEKPSISAKYTEARRIDQEHNFQTAQQKVGQTKLKAQTPTVRRAFTTPIGLPQAGGTGVLPRRSIMAQSASFTPATYDQPSVTEISPVTQRTGGVSTQIAPAPPRTLGFTPDAFELQLRNVLQNELAAQTGQMRSAMQTSTGQFLSTPETIASLPGFENLTPEQARSLTGVERRGLGALISGVGGLAEQRQTQFERQLGAATKGFERIQERKAKEQEKYKPIEIGGELIQLQLDGTYKSIYGKPKEDILSVEESLKLNVPFGTKKSEAYGLIPKDKEEELMGSLTKDQRTYLNTVQDNMRADLDVKEFIAVRDAYSQAVNARKQEGGFGDLVLLRTIAKLTDPTSAVREEEAESFQNAQAALSRYGIAITKKWWRGDQFSEYGRDQLLQVAKDRYNAKKNAYDQAYQFFDKQAMDAGLPSGLVAPYKILKTEEKSPQQSKYDKLKQEGGYSDEEMKMIFPELSSFNEVGSDTQAAAGKLSSAVINNKKVTAQPDFLTKVQSADKDMKEAGLGGLQINQSYRTKEYQAQLYKELSAKGARVALPGKSWHEKGLAIDVTNWKEAQPFLAKYGIINGLQGDMGHFSSGELNRIIAKL